MTKPFYDHYESCTACQRDPDRLCADGRRLHEDMIRTLTNGLAPPPVQPAKA